MSGKLVVEDYRENFEVKVARFFISLGYSIADPSGIAVDLDFVPKKCDYEMGLLVEPEKRRIFSRRKDLLAMVRYSNCSPWAMTVYGLKYFERAKALAEKIIESFGVDVTCRLEWRDTREEAYAQDWIP